MASFKQAYYDVKLKQCKPFVYSPLGTREIRVITLLPDADYKPIRCTLEHVSLDEEPEYEALSYTWGPDEINAALLINGKSVGVRRNLLCALYHFRQKIELPNPTIENPKPLKLWIDALCIDQNNDSERSSQVRMMGSIYENCKKLRIWLGEETLETETAIQHFQVSDSEARIALDCFVECICQVERDITAKYTNIGSFFDSISDMYRQAIESLEQDIWEPDSIKRLFHEDEREWINLATDWLNPTIEVRGSSLIKTLRRLLQSYLTNFTTFTSKQRPPPLRTYTKHLQDFYIDNNLMVEKLLNRIGKTIQGIEYDSIDFLNHVNIVEGLLDICKRDYWHRLWVIQEVVLGSEPNLYCGESELAWKKFEEFLLFAIDNKTGTSKSPHVPGFDVRFSPDITDRLRKTPAFGFTKAYSITRATGVRKISLRSLLTSFHTAQTKDPRDMVYGLLSLAEPSHGITPDYSKSAAELYFEIIEASLWKEPIDWKGTDDYLISFSRLLQRVLGEPFWNCEVPTIPPEMYDKQETLVLTGILGKRITWGDSSSTLTVLNNDETQTLPRKQQIWLELNSLSKHDRSSSSYSGNLPQETSTLYRQKFAITPYGCSCREHTSQDSAVFQTEARNTLASHLKHITFKSIFQHKTPHCPKHNKGARCGEIGKEEGTALLSTPSINGDYLCFFKDCDVAAVVRYKKRGTHCMEGIYSIVGHCVIDTLRPSFDNVGDSISPLENWTTKCEVEMSREILVKLTM